MVDLARSYNLSITFHRAIDESADIMAALDDVLSLGIERILTSGGRPSAPEGADVIKKMVERAAGRTVIMAGAGITPENVKNLIAETGVSEVHGSRAGIAKVIKNG